jgi:hypothetical protein
MRAPGRRLAVPLALAAIAFFATGCVETLTHLRVERDGSGVITLQAFFSKRGLQDLSAPAGGGGAGPSGPAPVIRSDGLTLLAKVFGPDVRLDGYKEIVRADGWQGFAARYRFPDVTRISLGPEIGDAILAACANRSLPPIAGYSFRFEPGPVATLTVLQPDPLAGGATGLIARATAWRSDAEKQRFLDSLAGGKNTVMVSVAGTVERTNARFRSTAHPDMVVLFHLDGDRILASPAGRRLVLGEASAEDLTALPPGLLAEEAGKRVAIAFR